MLCESIEGPLREASDETLIPAKNSIAKNEWLSDEAIQWLGFRGEYEAKGDTTMYAHSHNTFRHLARRDKRKDIEMKLQDGRWNVISPHLKDYQVGSVSIRGENGVLKSSRDRAQHFADMLRMKLWGRKLPRREIPPLLLELILRRPDGSEDLNWSDCEIDDVMSSLLNGRSVRPNGLGYEWVKNVYATKSGRSRIRTLMRRCFDESDTPEQFLPMHVIRAYKKGDAHSDMMYRFFAMINSLCKVLERLVARRITRLILPFLRKSFCGFAPGIGAEDVVFWLRRLQEMLFRSAHWALFMLALHFTKAFDNMLRHAIEAAMSAWGITGKLKAIALKLMKAIVKVLGVGGAPDSMEFELEEGGKTGSPLTPILFVMCIAWVWEGLDLLECAVAPPGEIRVERKILGCREAGYADDIHCLSLFQKTLEARTLALQVLGPPMGLYPDLPKSNLLLTAQDSKARRGEGNILGRRHPVPKFTISLGPNQECATVSEIRALCGWFARRVDMTRDIQIRKGLMWARYYKLKNKLRGSRFSRKRVLVIHNAMEGATFQFNLRTHTQTRRDSKAIDATRKTLHRAVMGWEPPWTAKGSKVSVSRTRVGLGLARWSRQIRKSRVPPVP